jgi:UDP-glucose 4-epimerase
MKVLVTGGAGFIGSHLVKRLVEEGHEVLVVDNLFRGRKENLSEVMDKITFVEADVNDMKVDFSPDVVFHLAAVSQVMIAEEDPELCFSANVSGTHKILEFCRKRGSKLIFSSSREVYGDQDSLPVGEERTTVPKNNYGISKALSEELIRNYSGIHGLDYVILRLSNVIGTRDSGRVVPIFVNNCLRGKPLTLYGGSQVLDLVSVSDVVEAMIKSTGVRNETINIGSGKALSVKEIAWKVKELTGSGSEIIYRESREKEVRGFQADVSKAKEILDWEPRISFEEEIRNILSG